MKNIIKLTALALAGALALTTGAVSADKTKVGFIYIGPPGDHGWTYAHDQGRLAIEKELGARGLCAARISGATGLGCSQLVDAMFDALEADEAAQENKDESRE